MHALKLNNMNSLATKIKIKIDTGTIPVLVANSKVLKLYTFYLVLKAFDTQKSGSVDYLSNIKELCKIMQISQRTFYNRLNACLFIDIIYRQDDIIKLASFGKVADHFGLNHSREFIEVDPGDEAIEYMIRSKAIQLNILDQRKAVFKKLESYKDKNYNPEQLRLKLCALLIASFVSGTAAPQMPSNLNPDITLSTTYTAKLFGCKSQSSGHYWQQTLINRGCLEVEPRTIESEARTAETKLIGKISWNEKRKTKFLTLRNLLKPL